MEIYAHKFSPNQNDLNDNQCFWLKDKIKDNSLIVRKMHNLKIR